MGLDDENEADSEASNLSCLVAVAIPQPHYQSHNVTRQQDPRVNARAMEFIYRTTIEGKFTYVDPR